MRGYNRNKSDLQPYQPRSLSREQVAEKIKDGHVGPVEYGARDGKLPPHLVRAPERS